jgi:translation initiation factor IF-3
LKKIKFRHRQPEKPKIQDLYPLNERIRVPQVRVIDDNNEMLGVLATEKALALAKERDLDLVLVSPKAEPPVAKFLDFGNFKYQKEKEIKKQKAQQKKTDIKEIRLSARIGQHDLDIRINQAEKFLKRGDKIIVEVMLKGRERQHPELAYDVIKGFNKTLGELLAITIEQDIKRLGNKFNTIIAAKSQ